MLAHNAAARRLYDGLAYVEAGRDRIEQDGWPPGPQDVLSMVKAIR